MRIILESVKLDEAGEILYSGSGGMVKIVLDDGTTFRLGEEVLAPKKSFLNINLSSSARAPSGIMVVRPRAANVVWISGEER